ncbi:MAG TPA: thioredoxin family protein [Patescibacteria group bacterium]|nr:thioredoxin family protein [Patescibacteria group bacterium]
MKNLTVILIIVIVLVLGGVGISIMSRKTSAPPETMTQPQNVAPQDKTASEGKYVMYTPSILADTANMKRVLFFYAHWCPICQPADADFRENTHKIPADVVVIRVNYNDTDTDESERDLAKKYGVTYQHTFVQIDQKGSEVTKWNGGQTAELLENLK